MSHSTQRKGKREKRRISWMEPVCGVYVTLGRGSVRESRHVLLLVGGGNPPHQRSNVAICVVSHQKPQVYTFGDVKETRWRPSYWAIFRQTCSSAAPWYFFWLENRKNTVGKREKSSNYLGKLRTRPHALCLQVLTSVCQLFPSTLWTFTLWLLVAKLPQFEHQIT